MNIEWDEDKRLANLRKHKVDFVAAIAVFADPNGKEVLEYVDSEERWRLIAKTPTGLLYVVYVQRGEKTRIISARKATRREARAYHSGKTD